MTDGLSPMYSPRDPKLHKRYLLGAQAVLATTYFGRPALGVCPETFTEDGEGV
jgi:hypothetical protein